MTDTSEIGGHSSVGRAPAWHAGVSGSNPLGSIMIKEGNIYYVISNLI